MSPDQREIVLYYFDASIAVIVFAAIGFLVGVYL